MPSSEVMTDTLYRDQYIKLSNFDGSIVALLEVKDQH